MFIVELIKVGHGRVDLHVAAHHFVSTQQQTFVCYTEVALIL